MGVDELDEMPYVRGEVQGGDQVVQKRSSVLECTAIDAPQFEGHTEAWCVVNCYGVYCPAAFCDCTDTNTLVEESDGRIHEATVPTVSVEGVDADINMECVMAHCKDEFTTCQSREGGLPVTMEELQMDEHCVELIGCVAANDCEAETEQEVANEGDSGKQADVYEQEFIAVLMYDFEGVFSDDPSTSLASRSDHIMEAIAREGASYNTSARRATKVRKGYMDEYDGFSVRETIVDSYALTQLNDDAVLTVANAPLIRPNLLKPEWSKKQQKLLVKSMIDRMSAFMGADVSNYVFQLTYLNNDGDMKLRFNLKYERLDKDDYLQNQIMGALMEGADSSSNSSVELDFCAKANLTEGELKVCGPMMVGSFQITSVPFYRPATEAPTPVPIPYKPPSNSGDRSALFGSFLEEGAEAAYSVQGSMTLAGTDAADFEMYLEEPFKIALALQIEGITADDVVVQTTEYEVLDSVGRRLQDGAVMPRQGYYVIIDYAVQTDEEALANKAADFFQSLASSDDVLLVFLSDFRDKTVAQRGLSTAQKNRFRILIRTENILNVQYIGASEHKKDNTMLPIIITIVVVIVLGGIFAFIYKRRRQARQKRTRKLNTVVPHSGNELAPAPGDAKPPKTNPGMSHDAQYVGWFVVLIVAIVVIVVLVAR
jgi:hypothetical protein